MLWTCYRKSEALSILEVRTFVVVPFLEKLAVIANAVNSALKLLEGADLRLHFRVIAAATPPP